ncbi:MAG TPA: flavin reductase family protein [Acidimicrobiia bacterium]
MKQEFRPSRLEERDVYKLLSGLIVPRPIGWIGTRRPDGTNNLAPYSFFNMVSSRPPAVMFASGRRAGELKDSAAYAEASGEFSVNIVSEDVAEAMNATSHSYPAGVDEFEMCGLTTWYGDVTSAPMVDEAPANLECRVVDALDLGGDTGTRVVFGEVVAIHVRIDVLDGTRVDHDALAAVGRLAGNDYVTTRDRFGLVRPTQ